MKNAITMDECGKIIEDDADVCRVHKRRKMLYLTDGSVWENVKKTGLLEECENKRNKILFWEAILNNLNFDKLNSFYKPVSKIKVRVENKSYLRNELERLGVNKNDIEESRRYWYLNLLYYLGNFQSSVKKIQRFYRGVFTEKLNIKKKAVKTIYKYFLNYKMKKRIPILIKHYGFLKKNNCINFCDPVTQESFMDVNPERWVICKYEDMENCWWFDTTSAMQLLGSPGSYSSVNPFNRREYPPEFLFDVNEKLVILKDKYDDIKNLTMEGNQLIENTEVPDCYSYSRYLLHIKSNVLFESFREIGYFFPRNLFLSYSLRELRLFAARLYESWYLSNEQDRIRIFPPDGDIYPQEFTGRISTCGSSIYLKSVILDTMLRSITFQTNYEDKIYSCLKTMTVLGSTNDESHTIIHQNSVCDCERSYNSIERSLVSLEILNNMLFEIF